MFGLGFESKDSHHLDSDSDSDSKNLNPFQFRHRELCGLQGDNIDGMKSRGGSHIMGGQRTTWG